MSEPGNIVLTCSGCRAQLQVKAQLAGKRVRCPRCDTVLDVPRVHIFDAAPPVASPTTPTALAASPTPPSPAPPTPATTLPTHRWMRSFPGRSWWTRRRKVLLAVIVGVALLVTLGVIFWRDRAERITVSGLVTTVRCGEDSETLLLLSNLEGPQVAVVIPREHVKRFPEGFSYIARLVRVTGSIGDYENGKAVFVTSPGQIRIVTGSDGGD